MGLDWRFGIEIGDLDCGLGLGFWVWGWGLGIGTSPPHISGLLEFVVDLIDLDHIFESQY